MNNIVLFCSFFQTVISCYCLCNLLASLGSSYYKCSGVAIAFVDNEPSVKQALGACVCRREAPNTTLIPLHYYCSVSYYTRLFVLAVITNHVFCGSLNEFRLQCAVQYCQYNYVLYIGLYK